VHAQKHVLLFIVFRRFRADFLFISLILTASLDSFDAQ